MKILAVTHNGKDAHSFWRCMGPLSYLEKMTNHQIEITEKTYEKEDIYWSEILTHDMVYIHRPCTKNDLTVIHLAKLCNVPVWCDFDDWLFDLPSWNPVLNFYGNPGTKNYVAHCLATCDVVSVTTSELYNRVRKVNPNVIICPNAYRNDLFPYRKEELEPRNPIAVWRGSNTHDGDLISVQDGFKSLRGTVHFLGSPAWNVLATMPKDSYQTLTTQDFLIYFIHIYKIRPKVFIFPLADCLFNRCKSNIAWMEALHAGAICVAPEFPEWKLPGCVNYIPGDSESFANAVNSVFDMDDAIHQEQVKLAFDDMVGLYGIDAVNKIRLATLNSLLGPTFERNKRDPSDQLLGLWALAQLTEVPMVRDDQVVS